jgi:Na+/alanine symporter
MWALINKKLFMILLKIIFLVLFTWFFNCDTFLNLLDITWEYYIWTNEIALILLSYDPFKSLVEYLFTFFICTHQSIAILNLKSSTPSESYQKKIPIIIRSIKKKVQNFPIQSRKNIL